VKKYNNLIDKNISLNKYPRIGRKKEKENELNLKTIFN